MIDEKIEIREVMKLNLTVDHRFMDGGRSFKLVRLIEEFFGDPERYLKWNDCVII